MKLTHIYRRQSHKTLLNHIGNLFDCKLPGFGNSPESREVSTPTAQIKPQTVKSITSDPLSAVI